MQKTIYYNDISHEINRLGLSKAEVARYFGITRQALHYRIKQDQPYIHWMIYGLSNYLGYVQTRSKWAEVARTGSK